MLFNFMIGDAKGKFDRIFVHMSTLMCLLLFPLVYINLLVLLFTNEYTFVRIFVYMFLAPAAFIFYPIGVKIIIPVRLDNALPMLHNLCRLLRHTLPVDSI